MKTYERGWPAHYVGAARCLFRRNTLVDAEDGRRVIVSTVGFYAPPTATRIPELIGDGRIFETLIFGAMVEDDVDVINANEQITTRGVEPWMIPHSFAARSRLQLYEQADAMHAANVAWVLREFEDAWRQVEDSRDFWSNEGRSW